MSIYNRARDAFNTWTNGTEHEKDNAAIDLARNSAAFAAEVVRLHEQLGKLADELHDAKVYDRGDASGQSWWVASRSAAARIRHVLKGAEE